MFLATGGIKAAPRKLRQSHSRKVVVKMYLAKRVSSAPWRKSLEYQLRLMSSTLENPVVDLPGQGQLRGSTKKSAWTGRMIYQFLGVQYAEAPIGKLRFKAPVPKAPWEGVKDATKYGRPAPSYNTILSVPNDKITPDFEDCINLCVYTNDLSGSKPVMVYVHGGGFYTGSADQFPPDYILEKDVVLVVPQYRLGPLGFLSTMTDTIPGNAGALDVILAFEWVQKYIQHFGGDPKQVTAFSQSAGSTLLSILTYSDLVREELFSKAIFSSSASFATWCYDVNPVANAHDIAKRCGCPKGSSVEELNDFMMKVDAKTLVGSHINHMQAKTPNGINTLGGHRFTIGGPSNLLPETTFNLMRKGKGRRNLPLLAGVAKHDATFLMTGLCDIFLHTVGYDNHKFNQFQMVDTICKTLGSDEQTGALAAFAIMSVLDIEDLKKGDFYAMVDGLFDLGGVMVVKGPLLREVQYHMIRKNNPTYLYAFDYEGEHTRFGYGEDTSKYPFDGGVAHSDDNIYLFPWPKSVAKLNEEDTKIAKTLVDLWTSFATTGVPTSPQVSSWPKMEHLAGPYLHIDKECTIGDNYYDEFRVVAKEKRNLKRNETLRKAKSASVITLSGDKRTRLSDYNTVVMALSNVDFEKVVVNIPSLGSLRGSQTTSAWTSRIIYQFLGVKYAEAPVGELRFKKPVPIAPWKGVKDATEYGRTFPSATDFEAIPEEEKNYPHWEDCISLCVYSTDLKACHPVMVYIHGGAFNEGGSFRHPPNYLLEKDIVLVVPQYRLGPLGFLATKTDTIPGNAGILDVILAFEWVQKYIQYFGGNAKNVTAFGQSAGAGIVSHLTMSPLVGEYLFHRVILQSGSSFAIWATHQDPIGDARKTAIASGQCNESSSIEAIEECLMKMDVKSLHTFAKNTRTKPVVGGPSGFLDQSPDEIFLTGAGRKNLPMMTGVTKHDGGFLLMSFYDGFKTLKGFSDSNFNSFKLVHMILSRFGYSDNPGILAAILGSNLWRSETLIKGDFHEMLNGLYDLVNTIMLKGPVLKVAQMNACANPQQTWLYSFDYEGEYTRFGYGKDTSKYPFKGGVAHSDDNIYLYPWPESAANLNEEDTKIAKKMVNLWTSFAINGIPSTEDLNWPPMTTPIGPYLRINSTSSVGQNFHDELTAMSRTENNSSRPEKRDKANSYTNV
ncbi:uncharacterized protein LOC132256077 [Phlebotomus argentipes]|uniref:uncharacterized protein LOC132256077 n=1 Tax=Phlebotomus argentipes TaxID=94469 RepID=UPI002892F46C|nr:uncharacterized protein LOC132256077 [Phlebotomus argentipes]